MRFQLLLSTIPGTPYLIPTDICTPNSPIIEYGRRILSKPLLTTTDPGCLASSLTDHKATLFHEDFQSKIPNSGIPGTPYLIIYQILSHVEWVLARQSKPVTFLKVGQAPPYATKAHHSKLLISKKTILLRFIFLISWLECHFNFIFININYLILNYFGTDNISR